MMNSFENWNEIKPIIGGGNPILPAGAYVCVVKNVMLGSSKAGDEMLTLAIDIADGDYKDHFKQMFERKKQFKSDAKWPCQYYQLTRKDEQTRGRFKGLITVFEKDNPAFRWAWEESALKGLRCGCIFREEEYIGTDSQVHTTTRCYALIPTEELADAVIPEKKCIAAPQDGFSDSDIPF